MNTILGGMFQSRLNANIREEKGYSYGVNSNFAYGKGPGAFRTGGDIVTAKSDAALVEFMKELRGIVGSRPITDEELTTAKDALIQRLPATFASVSSINSADYNAVDPEPAGRLLPAVRETRMAAITKDDVSEWRSNTSRSTISTIVIVGDRSVIEGPLKGDGHRADCDLRHRRESARHALGCFAYREAGSVGIRAQYPLTWRRRNGRRYGCWPRSSDHQSTQGSFSSGGLYQARSRPLLSCGRGRCAAGRGWTADGARSLSKRHRRRVLLPEARSAVAAFMD